MCKIIWTKQFSGGQRTKVVVKFTPPVTSTYNDLVRMPAPNSERYNMRYEELNGHFRERVRDRVAERLARSQDTRDEAVDSNTRDVIVLCIILLADENNISQAANRLFEMKKTDNGNSITYDDALKWIAKVHEFFPTEVSILFDLYEMQKHQRAITDIIAHMEFRLLEK